MIKYRKILELHEKGTSNRCISASLSCSRNTVSATLKAAETLGVTWPIPRKISNPKLSKLLFPNKGTKSRCTMPDFDYVHRKMCQGDVTLSLLW